ncbi:hypothetical protein [Methylobacterium sp. E-045]|uniref:hypothetical protein n=1 Tax=Methylobacterium sp. E-045 TaxID=2836575 RepID=UPI001FB9AD47|nr:hypothetical protein [Methylobacterium sp. E-045]MCJ2129869.1 hypothetical protein [Methylobacterium sp. E-045]
MAQVGRHMVRDALDLSAILDIDAEKRHPLCHRGSMVAVLLSGDGRGLSSLPQLARDREERVSVVHISKGSGKPALASQHAHITQYGAGRTPIVFRRATLTP